MNVERWKQVESLLQSALDRSSEERDTFLRDACAGDETLEREVRSILACAGQSGSFLQNPAIEIAARDLAGEESDIREDCGFAIAPIISLRTTGSSKN